MASLCIHAEREPVFHAISSRICYLLAADSILSICLNQMKASELRLAADRSLVSAWESHILTSSLLSLPLCTAYNDPFMLYSCRCYLFAANVAKKKKEKKRRISKRLKSTDTKGKGCVQCGAASLCSSLSPSHLFSVLFGCSTESDLEKRKRLSLQKGAHTASRKKMMM